jgi:hypothetical protein
LNRFRLVVSYNCPNYSETIEVQADDISAARLMCEKIGLDYENMLLRLESRNVFISKKMCGCEVDQNTTSSSFITTVT